MGLHTQPDSCNTPAILRKVSRLQLRLLAAVILLFPISSLAHQVIPGQLKMFLSETRTFQVKDVTGCAAQVSAAVVDQNIATITKVTPDTSYGTEVDFEVTASDIKAGNTTINVSWIGEDALNNNPMGPCQEDNTDFPHIIVVQVIDPDTISSANNQNSGTVLDPINTATGELIQYEPYDLYLGGPLPLYFQRYYASYLRRSYILGDLGNNWLSNFDWSLHWVGNFIVLMTDKGKVLKYTSDGQGNWTLQSSNDPTPYQIIQDQQEILLHDPNKELTYRFNAAGNLSEISDGKGNKLTLTYYDTDPYWDRLMKVEDGLGRELRFDYTQIDNIWKLYSVTEYQDGVAGRYVVFSYDYYNQDDTFHKNLTSFQDANGYYTQYAYTPDTAGTADWALMTSRTLPEGNTPYQQTFYTTMDLRQRHLPDLR